MLRVLSTLLTLGLFLFIFSCSQQDPLAAENNTTQQTIRTVDKNISLIPFTPKLRQKNMNKILQVSSYVTYANGGSLDLDYDDDIEIEIEFDVPRYSISEDATLTINVDTDNFIGCVDVNFYPHGITFSNPAILDIEAEDLDLTGVDPNAVKIYYDNPETGLWEEMECDHIDVNIAEGEIEIENARIPHFSRYAIGTE